MASASSSSPLTFASFLGLSVAATVAQARPLARRSSASSLSLLGARAPQSDSVPSSSSDPNLGGGGGGNIPVAIWAPLVVIPVLFIILMVFFRGQLLPRFASLGHIFGGSATHTPVPSRSRNASRANLSNSASGGPRVLTADDLAGPDANANNENAARREGNAAGAAAGAAAPGGGAPPRRTRRRPRRTPSQVSTKSLPAYMAEPGDQELVLARAREVQEDLDENDEDDVDATRTPLLDQSMSSSSSGSASGSGSSSMPQHDVSGDHQRSTSHPSIRPSMDSGMSSHDSHNTNRSSMHLIDVQRGEAPPYFEVVVNADNEESERRDEFQPAPPSGPPSSFRMPSAIKRFFPWGSNRQQTQQPPILPMQQHNGTQVSLVTQTPTSPTQQQHRSRLSSPSLASLVLSRSRSNNPVGQNPEASTSRTNISGPLPHSLIRTSFSYPSSGPTPEQVAFLSSTASLLRFGVPIDGEGREDLRAPPSFADVVPQPPATGGSPTGSPQRPRTNSTSSARGAPLSVSTGNLTSVQEQPTPVSPTRIDGLPGTSTGGAAADLVARAAFVPLPPSASTFAPERVPLPEEGDSTVDEFGMGVSGGAGSAGGMRGRISGSSVNTYETADTHLTDDTEVATAMGSPQRTPMNVNASLPRVAPVA